MIVDDHALLRRGLVGLIEEEPDLSVCAEVGTHHAAVEAMACCHPDLVILELDLEHGDGMQLVRSLRHRYPSVPVLVFSLHDAAGFAERALQDGAKGYVSKQETGEVVLVAIRRLLDGQQYLSPRMRTHDRSESS